MPWSDRQSAATLEVPCSRHAVQVDHPDARPLTEEEQTLLRIFRERLHQRVATVGLTVDDVRHLLKALHEHPGASLEVIRTLREEAATLLPGQGLFTYDWD